MPVREMFFLRKGVEAWGNPLFAHLERLTAEDDHSTLYADFLHVCTMADQRGMRAIWTGEYHGMKFSIASNSFIKITDISQYTKNVKLGRGTVIAPLLASDPIGK